MVGVQQLVRPEAAPVIFEDAQRDEEERVDNRHLKIWMGEESAGRYVPKPTPDEVLYVHPNPNGTRKMCQNCVLWMPQQTQCFIHDSDVAVPEDAICGYHVFGKPIEGETPLSRENMDPVSPELSGLERIPGGTSCDLCRYYEPQGGTQGVCHAVRGFEPEEETAVVEALGCCTRWTESEDGE